MNLNFIHKEFLLLSIIFTWQIFIPQDSNSPIIDFLLFFHDFTLIFIITILSGIFYLITTLILNSLTNRNILHGHLIETVWTYIPILILFFLAIPSLKILYLTDELFTPIITIKSIGHQWYWSYEFRDLKNFEFDRYILEYKYKQIFRLLDTDNHIIVPYLTPIRLLITSTDVIHSWTIPRLGIKIDATPGRLNQAQILLNRPGIYFGQCSEICGANHSFIPIILESTSINNFKNWINLNSLDGWK